MTFFATASGLMMEIVRSTAIENSNKIKQQINEFGHPGDAAQLINRVC